MIRFPGRWERWLAAAAALVAVLVVVNMTLFELNRRIQGQVNARAQFVQQTVQLEALNREIIHAIATLAVRSNDDALRTVLSQHGVTFTPTPGAPAPGAVGSVPSTAGTAPARPDRPPR